MGGAAGPTAFVLALVLGSAGVRCAFHRAGLAEGRGDLGVARRLFGERAHEVELVLLGSSRTQRGFDVAVLEEELAAAGLPVSAFNFGVPGTKSLEQDRRLRELLADPPPRLRWIVIEAGPIGLTPRKEGDFPRRSEPVSARSIEWHTVGATRRALTAIARLPLPLSARAELAGDHLGLFGRRLTNLGLCSERWLESRAARAQREWKEARAALAVDPRLARQLEESADPESPLARAASNRLRETSRGERGAKGAAAYARHADEVRAQNALPIDLGQLDRGLLDWRPDAARAAGVELVYVTLPGGAGSPEPLAMHRAGWFGPLLHFNDPDAYPELFTKAVHRDFGHLNLRGAELFSRRFARAFAEIIAPAESVDRDSLAGGSGPGLVGGGTR